jgi:hypothetical protein
MPLVTFQFAILPLAVAIATAAEAKVAKAVSINMPCTNVGAFSVPSGRTPRLTCIDQSPISIKQLPAPTRQKSLYKQKLARQLDRPASTLAHLHVHRSDASQF